MGLGRYMVDAVVLEGRSPWKCRPVDQQFRRFTFIAAIVFGFAGVPGIA